MERSKGRLANTLAVARVGRTLVHHPADQHQEGLVPVTRLVNRQQTAEGKPNINAKRVLRIMQANQLTLERYTGRRPGRTHDGIVIAARSNVRWCLRSLRACLPQRRDRRVLFAIDSWDRRSLPGRPRPRASPARWFVTWWSLVSSVGSGSARRRVVRQRLGVRRQGLARHRNCLGPQALFHASPLARIQRHRGGIRQDRQ